MNANPTEWLQLSVYLGLLALVTRPMGAYLFQVLEPGGKTWLDPLIRPLERFTYRCAGICADQRQDWRQYTASVFVFSLGTGAFTYALLRFQHLMPLNPQGFGPLSPDLAFNTTVSFLTNTNWQGYSGETTLSYFSQMVALTLHNFTSAATGIGIAAAVTRGLIGSSASTLGNFWVDLVRVTYYLLLPACLIFAVVLVSQGVIQNFNPYTQASRLESQAAVAGARDASRTHPKAVDSDAALQEFASVETRIPQGPVASQVAIKMLGTNGGGFFNANAAHPFENPTPLSSFLQLISIFAIGSGLTHYLGRMSGNPAHGWSVWMAMMLLFLAGILGCWWAEASGNPIHHALGIGTADGNMEGKEVRFGIFHSALFATITTDASCGAVNAMHDSFTPLGGLVALINIQLGEIIIGGVGSGLYGILVFIVLAVFIAGLMVGRTPEYLGKKIQAFEIQMALLALLVPSLSILGFASWAAVSDSGTAGLGNAGSHGLTEILYAFSSATGNNGSAFAGLNANTPWYNLTLGIAMLIGRFWIILPIMAMAGSFGAKGVIPPSSGTFPVSGFTFILLLMGTILLVGALNFLPALALGPIVEHFLMVTGQQF